MEIEIIVLCISAVLLILSSLAMYGLLMAKLLPGVFLKQRFKKKTSEDRGLRKYVFPEGRGISFEPHPSVRRYMPLYILFSNNGYKYIKCKTDRRVRSIEYEITLFNNKDRVVDVLTVSEIQSTKGECAEVMLHPDTSYVSVKVKRVNGIELDKEESVYYKLRDAVLYVFSSVLVTFLESFVLRVCLSGVITEVIETPWQMQMGIGMILASSVVIGGLSALAVIRIKCSGGVKVVWHDIK